MLKNVGETLTNIFSDDEKIGGFFGKLAESKIFGKKGSNFFRGLATKFNPKKVTDNAAEKAVEKTTENAAGSVEPTTPDNPFGTGKWGKKLENSSAGKWMTSDAGTNVASVGEMGLGFANSMLNKNTTYVGGSDKIDNGVSVAKDVAGIFGANASPWGAVAQGSGQLVGNLIGGGNRIRGAGSAVADGVATGLTFLGPAGWAASGVLSAVSAAGIGQRRNMKVADFSNEFGSGYTGSAKNVAKNIAMYSGKKAGTFDFGFHRRGQKALRNALRQSEVILNNQRTDRMMDTNVSGDAIAAASSYLYSGTQPQLVLGKQGLKFPELEAAKEVRLKFLQNGGTIEKNVIPTGALHKNKHHIEEIRPELEGQITEKGIPVVSSDVAENVTQFAEVESGEITFTKSVTEQLEDFYNNYKENQSDELAIELGKFLVEQILHNTIDKDKIIKKTE